LLFQPQHETPPSAEREQVWYPPQATATWLEEAAAGVRVWL